MSLNLPRELIDAKKADGNDDVYVVSSGKQALKFDETKTNTVRTLAISYPAGTNEISIYGTRVVPEFPISILVLVIALIPTIFFSRKMIR
ncbi:MAG: PEFG-CTERM sorting domain-containing protein [Thaumarchaeota archaeon]|nr:MAG: PEFG-CTERM sorting domain-containing protein [Nitrososphaerota archaeon]